MALQSFGLSPHWRGPGCRDSLTCYIGMFRPGSCLAALGVSSTAPEGVSTLRCASSSSRIHLRGCRGTGSDELISPLRPRGRTGVFHCQRHHRLSRYPGAPSCGPGATALSDGYLHRFETCRLDRLLICSCLSISHPFFVE